MNNYSQLSLKERLKVYEYKQKKIWSNRNSSKNEL